MKKLCYLLLTVLLTSNTYAYTIEKELFPGKYGHTISGRCDNGNVFLAASYYDEGHWRLAIKNKPHRLKSETLSDYKKAIATICGENASHDESSYRVGDKVYVHFQSGRKCPATVIISGKEQNKIEYNDYCESSFISSKQKGEQEWAPNGALSNK